MSPPRICAWPVRSRSSCSTPRTPAAQANYEVYKRTQKELIRNRFVLNSALRNPKVAQLPVIKQQVNPVDWLQDQISVSYPGDAEILEISMRGEFPDAVAALVNAVCDAYVEGVVHAERNDRLARLQNLEKIYNDTEEKLRQKRGHLNELVDSLGTGNAQTATQKQQIALDSYGAMRKEQFTNQITLMHAQSKLKAQQARVENLGQEAVPAEAIEAKIMTNPDYHAAQQRIEQIEQVLNTSKSVANEGHQDIEVLFEKHRRELADAQKKLEEVQPAHPAADRKRSPQANDRPGQNRFAEDRPGSRNLQGTSRSTGQGSG